MSGFVKICSYFPFGNGMALQLNNLKIPLTQGCFVPSLLELSQWIWRRFLYVICIFLSLPAYPPGKGHGPSFEFPLPIIPRDVLLQVWMKLTLWFWRRWNWKVYKHTDDGQAIRKVHLNLVKSFHGWNEGFSFIKIRSCIHVFLPGKILYQRNSENTLISYHF